ncbi:hypothetical protein G7Y89_g13572 [Cudoniella acicularis]|uniref:C2H2-type domain-containing protein n=1 Tax=Cudoniella acicularis TaxID=354080 RepID=A0A8H4VVX8_9HELO|nr:hypothetical protein G7Y89_g13572 [Cudoniella acicularis]
MALTKPNGRPRKAWDAPRRRKLLRLYFMTDLDIPAIQKILEEQGFQPGNTQMQLKALLPDYSTQWRAHRPSKDQMRNRLLQFKRSQQNQVSKYERRRRGRDVRRIVPASFAHVSNKKKSKAPDPTFDEAIPARVPSHKIYASLYSRSITRSKEGQAGENVLRNVDSEKEVVATISFSSGVDASQNQSTNSPKSSNAHDAPSASIPLAFSIDGGVAHQTSAPLSSTLEPEHAFRQHTFNLPDDLPSNSLSYNPNPNVDELKAQVKSPTLLDTSKGESELRAKAPSVGSVPQDQPTPESVIGRAGSGKSLASLRTLSTQLSSRLSSLRHYRSVLSSVSGRSSMVYAPSVSSGRPSLLTHSPWARDELNFYNEVVDDPSSTIPPEDEAKSLQTRPCCDFAFLGGLEESSNCKTCGLSEMHIRARFSGGWAPVDPCRIDRFGNTALHHAAAVGNTTRVLELMSSPNRPSLTNSQQNSSGETFLHVFRLRSKDLPEYEKVLRTASNLGFPFEILDYSGRRVSHRLDELRDHWDATPNQLSSISGILRIDHGIECRDGRLKPTGSQLSWREYQDTRRVGETKLISTLNNWEKEPKNAIDLERLIEESDIRIRNKQGHTALAIAAARGLGDAVTLLLKAGANPNTRSYHKTSVMDYALIHVLRAQKENKEELYGQILKCMSLLSDHGGKANVDVFDEYAVAVPNTDKSKHKGVRLALTKAFDNFTTRKVPRFRRSRPHIETRRIPADTNQRLLKPEIVKPLAPQFVNKLPGSEEQRSRDQSTIEAGHLQRQDPASAHTSVHELADPWSLSHQYAGASFPVEIPASNWNWAASELGGPALPVELAPNFNDFLSAHSYEIPGGPPPEAAGHHPMRPSSTSSPRAKQRDIPPLAIHTGGPGFMTSLPIVPENGLGYTYPLTNPPVEPRPDIDQAWNNALQSAVGVPECFSPTQLHQRKDATRTRRHSSYSRIHTAAPKFSCQFPGCRQQYTRRDNLLVHQRNKKHEFMTSIQTQGGYSRGHSDGNESSPGSSRPFVDTRDFTNEDSGYLPPISIPPMRPPSDAKPSTAPSNGISMLRNNDLSYPPDRCSSDTMGRRDQDAESSSGIQDMHVWNISELQDSATPTGNGCFCNFSFDSDIFSSAPDLPLLPLGAPATIPTIEEAPRLSGWNSPTLSPPSGYLNEADSLSSHGFSMGHLNETFGIQSVCSKDSLQPGFRNIGSAYPVNFGEIMAMPDGIEDSHHTHSGARSSVSLKRKAKLPPDRPPDPTMSQISSEFSSPQHRVSHGDFVFGGSSATYGACPCGWKRTNHEGPAKRCRRGFGDSGIFQPSSFIDPGGSSQASARQSLSDLQNHLLHLEREQEPPDIQSSWKFPRVVDPGASSWLSTQRLLSFPTGTGLPPEREPEPPDIQFGSDFPAAGDPGSPSRLPNQQLLLGLPSQSLHYDREPEPPGIQLNNHSRDFL